MQTKNLRSSLGIQVEILKTVKREGNARPTRILLKANLTHERLSSYLSELVTKKMISASESAGNKLYSLTDSGESFLKEIVEKEHFLSSFGLSF